MDTNINPGSFMAPAGGGGDVIAEAMARRGLAGGVTNQVGVGSPTFPNTAQISPVAAPQAPSIGAAGLQPASGGMPAKAPESEIIVKALTERLKHDSNVEKFQTGG